MADQRNFATKQASLQFDIVLANPTTFTKTGHPHQA